LVPSLGDVAYDHNRSLFLQGGQPSGWFERNYSEETAREIDCAVREIVARAAQRATKELGCRRELLERGAKELLEKETLSAAELQVLLKGTAATGKRARKSDPRHGDNRGVSEDAGQTHESLPAGGSRHG
jgi:ATP-dependent Zn protease